MASGGGGRGFGPPPPPAKPAGGTTGAQGDGTAPPLHASASAAAQADGTATASAAAQADGIAPPLHGSVAQADGTAPPLRGSASASAAPTGYAGMGAIRPQMRGAAGAGSREVNINSGMTTVQSDPPVTLSTLGNDGTRTRMEAQISTQPEQGLRISNVADAAANPPGRHDPRMVFQGAGSSFSVAQGVHMQGNDGTRTRMEAQISTQPEQGVRISNVADAAANPPGLRDPSTVVSQIQTGAGSSSSGGTQLLAQAIHSQTFVEDRTVLDGIERLARNREWNLLEEYLRGWLIRLLQSGLGSLAIRFHQGYVAPLRHLDSLYADSQEMRSQLDVIWESITRDPSYTELLASHPGNIVDLIMDYMRLHFPDVVGHTNPPNTTNQFWAFGVLLGRESKKAKLRCVLCQQLMTSDRVGQDMARHLRQSCPRMTPHWRAKVEAFSHESSSKKRPRAAASKQAGLSKVALPSWKMLISTEAQEAIDRLAHLRLNEGAKYHASILRGQLEAIAQLGNEPFFLVGRLEAAASALLDLMAAFMLEGQEASPALNELIVRVYKLQFLIPFCLAHVQPNAPTQMVQNQDETVSHSQQQHVAVPATQQQQQQQQVVAATSALPQEQAVAAQQQQQQVVAAQQQQEPVVAAQQEPVVAAQQQEQVVAAQQEPVVAAQQQQEQVVVPLGEDQVHHADHGDDPFNILMGDAELDQLLHFANEFLEGGQGDPPPLV